jgi:glycosyltransferase involved in cell wall biosynthesis
MDGSGAGDASPIAPPDPATVAIVQDHIVQRGGGERVLLSMAKALPGAPIHTSFFWPEETYAEFQRLDVRTAPVDRARLLRERHRAALPLFPVVFRRMRVEAPVVVCGTSGWAAGVGVGPTTRKVLYFHALARWLHEPESYLVGMGLGARVGRRVLDPWLRRWDQRAVGTADRLLVYSSAMQERVAAIYDREAEILPPPVVVDPEGPVAAPAPLAPGFFLCPCRLMAYKNIDVLLAAFRELPDELLVVAGDGPDAARLRSLAPPNVRFLGAVDDAGMRWLYTHAEAVVSAAYEPFGLTPLEGNAFGTRAVVLRDGGFRDTVVDGDTGLFFDELSPEAVLDAVERLRSLPPPDGRRLAARVRDWSEASFITRLRRIVHEEADRSG